jgi:hypothetical protein
MLIPGLAAHITNILSAIDPAVGSGGLFPAFIGEVTSVTQDAQAGMVPISPAPRSCSTFSKSSTG